MIEIKNNEISITGNSWLKANFFCDEVGLYFYNYKKTMWVIKTGKTRLLCKKLKTIGNWNWKKTWCINIVGKGIKEIKIFKTGKAIVWADKRKQINILDYIDTSIDGILAKYITMLEDKSGYDTKISENELRNQIKYEKNEENSYIKELLNSENKTNGVIYKKEIERSPNFMFIILNWKRDTDNVYSLFIKKDNFKEKKV